VCCIVWQCVAVCGSVLTGKIVAADGAKRRVCCSVLQCFAVCCSVLQHVAMFCSVLQCIAVRCNYYSVLQCVKQGDCCRRRSKM